jgi:hypothetical protein
MSAGTPGWRDMEVAAPQIARQQGIVLSAQQPCRALGVAGQIGVSRNHCRPDGSG